MAPLAYHRTWIIASLTFLFLCHFLWAQSTKSTQQPANRGEPTFKLPVDVIVVSAVVTDKEGNPVTDLTQRDFKVFEDGKQQAIQTFFLESYAPIQSGSAAQANPVSSVSEAAESNPPRPHMISMIIDDVLSTPDDHFLGVTKAIAKFVETDMRPEDQIEILSGSGRVRYPFSNDKRVLLEETGALLGSLNSYARGAARSGASKLTDLQAKNASDSATPDSTAVQETLRNLPVNPNDPSASEMDAQMVLADARQQNEENNYRSSSLFDVLRQHIRSLKHFDAAKDVVFFSAGFVADDDMVRHKLQEVVDQALQTGVVLNTVDARGLFNPYFVAPEKQFVSAQQPSSIVDDAYAKATPLSVLADETGGIFYHNNNDLYGGLQKLSIPKAVYYLTYTIAPHKPDDRYHHIKLEVLRPGLKLTYRNGYFTPKEELTFQRRIREDILEAMQTPGNLNEIPIDLGYNCDQEDDFRYNVSFLAKVDIRRLHFLNEDSRHRNLINLVVVVSDENGHYIDGLEKSIDFRLSDASYADLLSEGLTTKVTFKLTFGRYKIKSVVREGIQGRMGSLTKMIEVP